ncbi:hypothetical protein BC830DRAFT_1141112, partial [Chytriomyces sp. MP71]
TVPDACAQLSYKLKECITGGGFSGRFSGKCKELQQAFEHCLKVEFDSRRQQSIAKARERAKTWKEADKDIGL